MTSFGLRKRSHKNLFSIRADRRGGARGGGALLVLFLLFPFILAAIIVMLFDSVDDQSESQSLVVDPLLLFDCCMPWKIEHVEEDGERTKKMPRMKRRETSDRE
jgi:hypothetical protein